MPRQHDHSDPAEPKLVYLYFHQTFYGQIDDFGFEAFLDGT